MDTKKFYNNVRYLINEKRIKISDFEHTIGHPTGYISRLEYKDSVPKIDTAVKMAEVFGITVEQLVNGSFDEMNATDVYLLRFLDKLISETRQNSIKWKKCVMGFAVDMNGAKVSVCQDSREEITVAIELADGLRQEVCSTYRQNEVSEAVKELWNVVSSDFRKISVPDEIRNVIDSFMEVA